jgi:hypothetical protein
MKLKNVHFTKQPGLAQMLNMAANITAKFNTPSVVEVKAWDYGREGEDANQAVFEIYRERLSPAIETFTSWPALMDRYFEMMKG